MAPKKRSKKRAARKRVTNASSCSSPLSIGGVQVLKESTQKVAIPTKFKTKGLLSPKRTSIYTETLSSKMRNRSYVSSVSLENVNVGTNIEVEWIVDGGKRTVDGCVKTQYFSGVIAHKKTTGKKCKVVVRYEEDKEAFPLDFENAKWRVTDDEDARANYRIGTPVRRLMQGTWWYHGKIESNSGIYSVCYDEYFENGKRFDFTDYEEFLPGCRLLDRIVREAAELGFHAATIPNTQVTHPFFDLTSPEPMSSLGERQLKSIDEGTLVEANPPSPIKGAAKRKHARSKPKATTHTKSKRKKNDVLLDVSNKLQATKTRSSGRSTRQMSLKRGESKKLPYCDPPAVPETMPCQKPTLPSRSGHKYAFAQLPLADSFTYTSVLMGSDSLVGSHWLCFLAYQQGRIPDQNLWKELIALLTHGPRSNGKIFPDVPKMTIVLEYVELIFEKAGLDFTEPVWNGDICKATFLQIKSTLYGDETNRNATIHAKMCSARLLRRILEDALTESVGNGIDPTDKMRKLGFTDDAKSYFLSAVEVLASTSDLEPDTDGEFFTLRDDLGLCVSFLAWWYGAASNADADALADLFAVVHPPELGVLNLLNRALVPQVRPKVAGRWELSEKYNLIYG